MFPDRKVGFNLHGLVGAGTWNPRNEFDGRPFDRHTNPHGPRFDVGFRGGHHDETFFVAEPEAQVVVRFGTLVRLQGGVGYRTTSGVGPSGASGSISVQFGR
jgi:hypothetical protein